MCADCTGDLAAGPLPYARARALYRGRNQGDRHGAEARQLAAYYELVDFKEAAGHPTHSAVPLGFALADGIRLLMREEGLSPGALLVPAPSFGNRRPHIRLLAERAAHVFPSVVLAPPDALVKVKDFKQAALTRVERRTQSLHAYRASNAVRNHVVIVADDFLTTGATLVGCAAALQAAGASAVYGVPLVRVITPPAPTLVREGATRLRLEWIGVARNGDVVGSVPERTIWGWVLTACPTCPAAAPHGPLQLPADGQQLTYTVRCTCGTERRLHVGRQAGRYRVHLDGARGSALWFAPWREET